MERDERQKERALRSEGAPHHAPDVRACASAGGEGRPTAAREAGLPDSCSCLPPRIRFAAAADFSPTGPGPWRWHEGRLQQGPRRRQVPNSRRRSRGSPAAPPKRKIETTEGAPG